MSKSILAKISDWIMPKPSKPKIDLNQYSSEFAKFYESLYTSDWRTFADGPDYQAFQSLAPIERDLAEQLLTEEATYRYSVISMLGHYRITKAIGALARILSDGKGSLRAKACWALWRITTRAEYLEQLPLLKPKAGESESEFIDYILIFLDQSLPIKLRLNEALPYLDHEDYLVRANAMRALTKALEIEFENLPKWPKEGSEERKAFDQMVRTKAKLIIENNQSLS